MRTRLAFPAPFPDRHRKQDDRSFANANYGCARKAIENGRIALRSGDVVGTIPNDSLVIRLIGSLTPEESPREPYRAAPSPWKSLAR